MAIVRLFSFLCYLCCLPFLVFAQNGNANKLPPVTPPDTSKNSLLIPLNISGTGQVLTLQQCIDYAMIHQPGLNKANINIEVQRETNGVNLSGLLPQVNASGDFDHYLQQSSSSIVTSGGGTTTGGTTVSGGTGSTGGTTTGGTGSTGGTSTGGTSTTGGTGTTGGTTTGTGSSGTGIATRTQYKNTFIPGVTVTQAIFSPSLFYAARSAPLYLKEARQATDSTKIFLVSSVTKSYYNVLLTLEQINVLKEDTARLGRNLRDAYHQYKGGIVDETDYEEAAITLNNSKAQLKQANENVIPQYAALKQLMGYPVENDFNVSFDTVQMVRGIYIDTTRQLQYEKRIEFQLLRTNSDLQSQLVKYYSTAFLPTVSAFFNYNLTYGNNSLSNLFSTAYPSSLVGLSLDIPIFTGFARTHNLRKARLQQELIRWDEADLKLQINKEYTTALANYKGNYYNLQLLQKNVALAKRVYFVVGLQYKQGIVAYLNVITAESNLITSEISYLNALFQVLSNKVDLEKAMGSISY